MKRDQLSGIAALRHALAARVPSALRARTVLEPLEPRMLYSAVPTGGLSPLLTGAAVPQSSVLGLSLVQQVEVATVRSTGSVGPFVRIDVAQLQELRAEAVARRQDLFERAGGRGSDVLSAGGGNVLGSSGQSADSAADREVRVAARAARVAAAWNRIQDALDAARDTRNGHTSADPDLGSGTWSNPTVGGEPAGSPESAVEPAAAPIPGNGDGPAAAPQPPDWNNPIIAIIDRGSVIPLNPSWEPVVTWMPSPDVLGSPAGGSVSEGIVSVWTGGGEGAGLTFRGASVPVAMTASTSGDANAYAAPAGGGGDPEADLQAMDAQARGDAGGPAKSARPAVAVVGRGEEDEYDSRRAERSHGLMSAREHDSVIASQGGEGGIVGGGDASGASVASAGGRGLVTLAGISTVASLLADGAGGVAGAAGAAADNASIVVAPNGLAAIAAAADIAAPVLAAARAANAGGATGVVANGALSGAQRVLEIARDAASAATAALPALPSLPEAVPAAGAGTLDIAMTPGTFLGLAPVWNWAGPSTDDAGGIADSENLGRAWRVAAAGSLVVTLAGCWYCVTASKRFRRNSRRRRASDHAKFATARRIRFNPQPL